jgi:hypothetical protein
MTVHLISVGLSILDVLTDPGQRLNGKPDLIGAIHRQAPHKLFEAEGIGDDREAASKWLAGALGTDGAGGGNPASARLDELAAAIRPDLWPQDMSAETATFGGVPDTGFPLRSRDIAVLICSDTARGLLAGAWNAFALTEADPARIRYLPEPGGQLGDIRGRALLARVPFMDAGNEAGFRQAMAGLGLLARHIFESGQLGEGEEFRFYLSGGFKAAIPYLIGLAEIIRSVDAVCLRELGVGHLMPDHGIYPVAAFVLHETAGPHAPPIRLPLRRLDAEAVRYELSRFDRNGHRDGKPDGALLQGYAYEIQGRPGKETSDLTAFGAGLRALFGILPEGYGG